MPEIPLVVAVAVAAGCVLVLLLVCATIAMPFYVAGVYASCRRCEDLLRQIAAQQRARPTFIVPPTPRVEPPPRISR